MARSVCIETSVDIDIANYIDRLSDDELIAEVKKRSKERESEGKSFPAIEGDGQGGPCCEEPTACIYLEELADIRDAIKTSGDQSAMVLVRSILCRELGCIL